MVAVPARAGGSCGQWDLATKKKKGGRPCQVRWKDRLRMRNEKERVYPNETITALRFCLRDRERKKERTSWRSNILLCSPFFNFALHFSGAFGATCMYILTASCDTNEKAAHFSLVPLASMFQEKSARSFTWPYPCKDNFDLSCFVYIKQEIQRRCFMLLDVEYRKNKLRFWPGGNLLHQAFWHAVLISSAWSRLHLNPWLTACHLCNLLRTRTIFYVAGDQRCCCK